MGKPGFSELMEDIYPQIQETENIAWKLLNSEDKEKTLKERKVELVLKKR